MWIIVFDLIGHQSCQCAESIWRLAEILSSWFCYKYPLRIRGILDQEPWICTAGKKNDWVKDTGCWWQFSLGSPVSFTAIINIGNIPIWNLFYFLSIWIHEGHIRIVCLVVFFFVQDSGDIHFLASVQDWYNPYNWQDIASLASSIILHTDNVPCVHDTAVFPQVIIIIKALSHLTLSIQCMNFGYPYHSFLGSIICTIWKKAYSPFVLLANVHCTLNEI